MQKGRTLASPLEALWVVECADQGMESHTQGFRVMDDAKMAAQLDDNSQLREQIRISMHVRGGWRTWRSNEDNSQPCQTQGAEVRVLKVRGMTV